MKHRKLPVSTHLKAGDINGHTGTNHNEALRVASHVKAGDNKRQSGTNATESARA